MDENVVIFDLDGTLIDTIGDLAAAVERALEEGGFPGHGVEEYRRMVGHGIRNLVTRALPEGASEETVDSALKVFKDYYTTHIDVYSRPYPGIHDLLRALSAEGISIAVVSNKFQEGTETLIRRFFPDITFKRVLGNAPGHPLKPDPEVVFQVVGQAARAVMVGDSATDIKTARNAGIPAIGVSWGFRPRADLEIADAVADDTGALRELIFSYIHDN